MGRKKKEIDPDWPVCQHRLGSRNILPWEIYCKSTDEKEFCEKPATHVTEFYENSGKCYYCKKHHGTRLGTRPLTEEDIKRYKEEKRKNKDKGNQNENDE